MSIMEEEFDRKDQEELESGELVAGLDIGTTKICAVISEMFADGRVDIIGVGTSE